MYILQASVLFYCQFTNIPILLYGLDSLMLSIEHILMCCGYQFVVPLCATCILLTCISLARNYSWNGLYCVCIYMHLHFLSGTVLDRYSLNMRWELPLPRFWKSKYSQGRSFQNYFKSKSDSWPTTLLRLVNWVWRSIAMRFYRG